MSDRDPLAQYRGARVVKRDGSSRPMLTRQRLARETRLAECFTQIYGGVRTEELHLDYGYGGGWPGGGVVERQEPERVDEKFPGLKQGGYMLQSKEDELFPDVTQDGDMVEEKENLVGEVYGGKGKGRARDEKREELKEQKKDKVFRLMDLPAEIRLEIYRACMTRPWNIQLSKVEHTPPTLVLPKQPKERERSPRVFVLDENGQSPLTAWRQRRGGRSTNSRVGLHRRAGASRSPALRAARAMASQSSTPPRPREDYASYNFASDDESGRINATSRSVSPSSDLNTQTPAPKRNYASPDDPLIIALLRTSKQVYREARDVLYSENVFTLSLDTAVPTLACLHQRSRRHIKFVDVEIPTYTEIIERFSEVVRLSLRYCSGLRRFTVHTPFTLPGAEGGLGSNHGTVYANGFDILRWLPQQCEVVLSGTRNAEIEAVVGKHLMLAKAQDRLAYARRQAISSESGTSTTRRLVGTGQ